MIGIGEIIGNLGKWDYKNEHRSSDDGGLLVMELAMRMVALSLWLLNNFLSHVLINFVGCEVFWFWSFEVIFGI